MDLVYFNGTEFRGCLISHREKKTVVEYFTPIAILFSYIIVCIMKKIDICFLFISFFSLIKIKTKFNTLQDHTLQWIHNFIEIYCRHNRENKVHSSNNNSKSFNT